MVRWLRWHCPPDTGFEIRAPAVWGRARGTSRSRRLSTILSFTRGWGRNTFCFFQTAATGNRTPNSGVKGSGANHYPRAPAQADNKATSHQPIRGKYSNLTLRRYIENLIFIHLKLCLATASHNFKWVKITHICLIWDETFANLDVYTLISVPITVIWSANKSD